MIPNQQELKELLHALSEDLAKQEEASQMMLAIQKRLMTHSKATFMKPAKQVVAAVYQEQMQILYEKILLALKQLEEFLKEQRWASPPIQRHGSDSEQ